MADPRTSAAGRRVRARGLHGQAHRLRWSDSYSRARIRGDHDRAEDLERRARTLDVVADWADARAWTPAARATGPYMDADELGAYFDRFDRERLEKLARRARWKGQPKTAGYVAAALEREELDVANAPVGLRNATLNKAAYTLARFEELDDNTIVDVLTHAAIAAGLTEREASSTINSALRARRR